MNIINKKRSRSNQFFYLFSFLVVLAAIHLSSCSTPKNVTYFKDIPDTVKQRIIVNQAEYFTPVIQPDDILQVTIQTLDPTTSSLLNQQNTASWPTMANGNAPGGGNTASGNVSGYLVDKDGNIMLPLIGKIQVKDFSTDQVRDKIQDKIKEYYKDPVVNVRFANFRITILGEVNRPSTYVMPNERITLLDAIGMAGDLTIYGKRENILLVRDNKGKKEFARFNLNDSKVFTSPYFYLHQGDVIYVEPNKGKVASSDMVQVKRIAIMTSAISLLIILISRINF